MKAKAKKKLAPLTPPDLKRCQAMKPNGYNFMTLGGRPGRERCENKPRCIVYETKPDTDGCKGSMSLCVYCFPICMQQMKDKKLRFELIEPAP